MMHWNRKSQTTSQCGSIRNISWQPAKPLSRDVYKRQVNALAAANRIIIPVQAEYLPAKGLEQLLSTVSKVKRQINRCV